MSNSIANEEVLAQNLCERVEYLYGRFMTRRILGKLTSGAGLAALVTCAICALPAGAVHAQTITENLTADLSGFIDIAGSIPSPVSAIDASFTVTFNPTLSYSSSTSGLTVDTFTGTTVSYPFEYDWNPATHILSVGASQLTGYIYAGQNEVAFQFNLTNPAAPKLSVCSDPGFSCGTANGNALFYASGYTLSTYPNDGWLATVANGVSVSAPEMDAGSAASALTLLIGGIAVFTGRRQLKVRSVAAQN